MVVVVLLSVLLAERAPELARDIGRWVDDGDSAPARVLGRFPLPRSAYDIHVIAWAVTAFVIGLVSWSWRSFVLLLAATLAGSWALELAQDLFTESRHSQFDDAVANTIGVAVGAAGAAAVIGMWRVLVRAPADGRFHRTPQGEQGRTT